MRDATPTGQGRRVTRRRRGDPGPRHATRTRRCRRLPGALRCISRRVMGMTWHSIDWQPQSCILMEPLVRRRGSSRSKFAAFVYPHGATPHAPPTVKPLVRLLNFRCRGSLDRLVVGPRTVVRDRQFIRDSKHPRRTENTLFPVVSLEPSTCCTSASWLLRKVFGWLSAGHEMCVHTSYVDHTTPTPSGPATAHSRRPSYDPRAHAQNSKSLNEPL